MPKRRLFEPIYSQFQPKNGYGKHCIVKSLAKDLPHGWIEKVCKCELGEPHFRYERTDCGTVCRDHSNCGTVLKSHWIGCGQYSDQELRPHKTALAAIKKLDKLYPIETN